MTTEEKMHTHPLHAQSEYEAALAEAEETKDQFENFSRRDVLAFIVIVTAAVIVVGIPVLAAVAWMSGK